MNTTDNVITIKQVKCKAETTEIPGKSYRTLSAPEKTASETYRTPEKTPEDDQFQLDQSLFSDINANKKGISNAVNLIKSEHGRNVVVNAITTNGLDKSKVIAGLTAVLKAYQSGQIVRIRALCEDIATDNAPRKFLESSIIPMLVELNIIIRDGERSAYWQPHNLIGKTPGLVDRITRLLELTPAQRELKELADQLYAEQKKLNALRQREMTMQQQKQAYMRITTQQQQLAELAAQNPMQATLLDKAKANPGATLILATLIAGVMTAAINTSPPTDTPMPTVSAAMQSPTPQPDTAAVSAIETAKINQQMKGVK